MGATNLRKRGQPSVRQSNVCQWEQQTDDGDNPGRGKGRRALKRKKKTPGSIRIVDQFRDGTKLCRDFQYGRCQKENCTKGRHRCGLQPASGRVCGMRHSGQECPNKKKGGGKGGGKR